MRCLAKQFRFSALAWIAVPMLGGCAAFGGGTWFKDQTGETAGACSAEKLTIETAGGNVTLERGEVEGSEINQSHFNWYCGELRGENLGRTSCPEGSGYIEVARNYVGPGFLVTCYED